ncbi:hypothetical protein M431DRAFT_541995, partial [Trichoderma harzianum CBS 226.95]
SRWPGLIDACDGGGLVCSSFPAGDQGRTCAVTPCLVLSSFSLVLVLAGKSGWMGWTPCQALRPAHVTGRGHCERACILAKASNSHGVIARLFALPWVYEYIVSSRRSWKEKEGESNKQKKDGGGAELCPTSQGG